MKRALNITLGLLLLLMPLLLNQLMRHFQLMYSFDLQTEYTLPKAIKDLFMLGLVCTGIYYCVRSYRLRFTIYALVIPLYLLGIGFTSLFKISRYEPNYVEQAEVRYQFLRIDGGAFTTTSYLLLQQLKPFSPLFFRYCTIDSYEGMREGKIGAVETNSLTLILTSYNDESIQVVSKTQCDQPS